MPDPIRKPTGNLVFRFCGGIRDRQSVRSDDPQTEREAQSYWATTWNEASRQRLNFASPNEPPSAALTTSENRPVLHPLTIQLSDGSSLDIDQDEWPTLGSPGGESLDLGQHATEHLFLGKFDDGRTLVYVVIEQPDTDKTIAGEMLPAGSADIETAVCRVAEKFGISARLVDHCLNSIKQSPN